MAEIILDLLKYATHRKITTKATIKNSTSPEIEFVIFAINPDISKVYQITLYDNRGLFDRNSIKQFIYLLSLEIQPTFLLLWIVSLEQEGEVL